MNMIQGKTGRADILYLCPAGVSMPSLRNLQYIEKQERTESFQGMEQEVKGYFQRHQLEQYPALYTYQIKYCGLKLSTPVNKFTAFLFSKQQIENDIPPEPGIINGDKWYNCGAWSDVPYRIVMNTEGIIGSYKDGSGKVISNYASFDTLISHFSKENFFLKLKWIKSPYFEIKNEKAFRLYARTFRRSENGSDAYNSWFTNNHISIHRGIFLGADEPYISCYAAEQETYDIATDEMKREGIIY